MSSPAQGEKVVGECLYWCQCGTHIAIWHACKQCTTAVFLHCLTANSAYMLHDDTAPCGPASALCLRPLFRGCVTRSHSHGLLLHAENAAKPVERWFVRIHLLPLQLTTFYLAASFRPLTQYFQVYRIGSGYIGFYS